MTPTPPSNTFSHFRFRRSRNAVPYDATNNGTPTAQTPVTPLVDEGAGELEDDDVDADDDDEGADDDDEGADEDEGSNIDEDGNDGEDDEGEGGIEEEMNITRPGGPNVQEPPATIQGGLERVIRPPIPRFRIVQNREAIVRSVVQLANGLFRRRTVPMEIDTPFDPSALGLKEIGNLASWTVSSCKPGCGVEALRDEDTGLFWQSDGPQPHHLNIHFSRLVSIVSIRIFLDFEADESYTPTRITLLAGTGYHDLIPFSALEFAQPKGWIDVPLDHVGGGEDGKTLRAFLVQVRIVENHQNGKDTHVRGLKVYARDERVRGILGGLDLGQEEMRKKSKAVVVRAESNGLERGWMVEPDWMGEPELR